MASQGEHDAAGGSRATKRQKATVRGPNSSPRGDSPPPFIHFDHRFINAEAIQFYSDEYRNRNLIQEKTLVTDLVNPEFVATLRARGWDKLMTVPPGSVNDTLVKEFFANLDKTNLKDGYVWVRGVEVPFSAELINIQYGLPPSLERNYKIMIKELHEARVDVLTELKDLICPHVPWTRGANQKPKSLPFKYLPEDWKVIVRFIHNRIMPRYKPSKVGVEELFVVAALVRNLPIDFGAILYNTIEEHLLDRSRCIIIPHLITHMCRDALVPEYDEDMVLRPVRGIQRENERGAPPVQPAQHHGASGSVPLWISDEERRSMSMNDSLRRFMQDQQNMQNNIVTGIWLLSRNEQARSQHIYRPSTMDYSFMPEIESMMDRVRLEAPFAPEPPVDSDEDA